MPLQIVACFAIRLTHYVVLTAALVWIVLGGVDAYVGSYDTLTGWLGILPEGERGALIVTVVLNVALADLLQRHPGARVPLGARRRGRRTPPAIAAPAAGAGEDRGSLRFDPRAITLAAAVAFALLLSGTGWALLASVAAFLALAWAVSRCDREALGLGLALTALLAFGALVASLVAGLGIDEALRRGTRAGLLVLVATWLRAAAGPAGLRETFRRMLWRIRCGAAGARGERDPRRPRLRRPPDRLRPHAGRRARAGRDDAAAGRRGRARLGRGGGRGLPRQASPRARARLAVAPRDGLLVALAVAPALALFAHG